MRDERTDFVDDLGDGSAAFGAAGLRDDAKSAMHIAALHDGNERGRLFRFQFLFADCFLGAGFLCDIDNRETRIVYAPVAGIGDPGYNLVFSYNQFFDVIGNAMEFLRADDKIDMRQILE
jgi:hypothetical protein